MKWLESFRWCVIDSNVAEFDNARMIIIHDYDEWNWWMIRCPLSKTSNSDQQVWSKLCVSMPCSAEWGLSKPPLHKYLHLSWLIESPLLLFQEVGCALWAVTPLQKFDLINKNGTFYHKFRVKRNSFDAVFSFVTVCASDYFSNFLMFCGSLTSWEGFSIKMATGF
jgi:hypothetical protein